MSKFCAKRYPSVKCHCPLHPGQQVIDAVFVLKKSVANLHRNEGHLVSTGKHFSEVYTKLLPGQKTIFDSLGEKFPNYSFWNDYLNGLTLFASSTQSASTQSASTHTQFSKGSPLDYSYRTAQSLDNLIDKRNWYKREIEQSVKLINEIAKCKHHGRELVFALYKAGVGLQGAKQHADEMKEMDDKGKEKRLNQIFEEMVGNQEAGRHQPTDLTAGDGFYILQKMVQLAALPLGSMTGTKLANLGKVFNTTVEGKYFLAGAGWIVMMALFFSADPPSSIPEYTKRKGVNVLLLGVCFALAAVFNIPSMQLTQDSAHSTFDTLLHDTAFGKNPNFYAQLSAYANLALNTILSTSLFSTMISAVSATVLSKPTVTENIITGLKAIMVLGFFYITDGYVYVNSGLQAIWVKDIDSLGGRYSASALLNLPTVMFAVLPTVYGSSSKLINDHTRHWFKRAFIVFSGLAGAALFAALFFEEAVAAEWPKPMLTPFLAGQSLENWTNTLRLAMTLVTAYVSFEAMARAGADSVDYIARVPGNMRHFVVRTGHTLSSCVNYFTDSSHAQERGGLLEQGRDE